ncbi:MAG: uroporphyrinogen decarboxylase [Verrucomicrobiota bacterium]
MNSRQLFLSTLKRQSVMRPPVWIMRQAGRYLPEYRELKKKYSFRKMVENPELATDVTMMPLRRFPLDAAITFSDILVIPEALGVPYQFDNERGISMERRIQSANDIKQLKTDGVVEHLSYVFETQRLLRQELGDSKALLGFAGTPWTLAAYMVEGGGSIHYETLKKMAWGAPETLEALLEILSKVLIEYLREQAHAGVDAVQLFDSAAPGCPGAFYENWSLKWVKKVIEGLKGEVPLIYFVRGMGNHLPRLADIGADVLSLDWTLELPKVACQLDGKVGVQGNFDPVLLCQPPEIVRSQTRILLDEMKGVPGYIANLGHGILPQAKIDAVETFVDTVTSSG